MGAPHLDHPRARAAATTTHDDGTSITVQHRLRHLVRSRAKTAAAGSSAISDEQYSHALSLYAAMAHRVLGDPERWLGVDSASTAPRALPQRVVRTLRRGALGDTHPGSHEWSGRTLDQRTRWWTARISLTAGTAAAAPRFSGLVADRLPLQSILGASAAGLAVCAVARENGLTGPGQWVPLLGQVILGRDIAVGEVPGPVLADEELHSAAEDPTEPPGSMERLGDSGRRAVRVLWRLARALSELQGAFDHRPRGSAVARVVAKVPVVGVAGGWFDERGGIRRAARETQRLLESNGH